MSLAASLSALPRELRELVYGYLTCDATVLWSQRPTPLRGPLPDSAHITLHDMPLPSRDLKLGAFKREYADYPQEPCRSATIRIGAEGVNSLDRKRGRKSPYAAALSTIFEHLHHVSYFIDCSSVPYGLQRNRVPSLEHWNMVGELGWYLTWCDYPLKLTSIRVSLLHGEECNTTRRRKCMSQAPSGLGADQLDCVQRGNEYGYYVSGKETEVHSMMEWYAYGDRVWEKSEVDREWTDGVGRWSGKWMEELEMHEKHTEDERRCVEEQKVWKEKREKQKEQRRTKRDEQKEIIEARRSEVGEKAKKRKRKRKDNW